jgi:hypothetical protein
VCHISCPPHPPWFNHSSSIQWRIIISYMVLLIFILTLQISYRQIFTDTITLNLSPKINLFKLERQCSSRS